MPARCSVSSWSLHEPLGEAFYHRVPGSDTLVNRSAKGPDLALLDLPGRLPAMKIGTLELCHFHIPSLDPTYLASLKRAIADADVELYSLLLDFGDIAHPDDKAREADLALLLAWIDVAGVLGAQCVRVDAGRQVPCDAVIARSVAGLRRCADHAATRGVAVITENWHETSQDADVLLEILDRCDGSVGLCADFGNARGPKKYQTLAALLPRAGSIHAKADYDAAGNLDADDLARVLTLVEAASFDGPMSLINGKGGDAFANLVELRDAIRRRITLN